MEQIIGQILMGGTAGAITAGLLIRGINSSDGRFMGVIQLICGAMFIFLGISEIATYTVVISSGIVVLTGICGYYFIPKLKLSRSIGSANLSLKEDSDLSLIFGRELGETEKLIVREWVSTFGTHLYGKKNIFVAPKIDEKEFNRAKDKICSLPENESAIVHFENGEYSFLARFGEGWGSCKKIGVLITTKGVYWRLPDDIQKQISFKDIDVKESKIIKERSLFSFNKIKLAPVADEGSAFDLSGLTDREGTDDFLEVLLTFIKGAANIAQRPG